MYSYIPLHIVQWHVAYMTEANYMLPLLECAVKRKQKEKLITPQMKTGRGKSPTKSCNRINGCCRCAAVRTDQGSWNWFHFSQKDLGEGRSTLSAECDDRKPPQASIHLWVLLQGIAPQPRCTEWSSRSGPLAGRWLWYAVINQHYHSHHFFTDTKKKKKKNENIILGTCMAQT